MDLKTRIREAYQRDPQISGEALLKELGAPNTAASRQALIEVQSELRGALYFAIRYTKGRQRHANQSIAVNGGIHRSLVL